MMRSLGGFTLGLLVMITVSYPTNLFTDKLTVLYHLWKKRNHVWLSEWVTWLASWSCLHTPVVLVSIHLYTDWSHGTMTMMCCAVSDKGVTVITLWNLKFEIIKATKGNKPVVKKLNKTLAIRTCELSPWVAYEIWSYDLTFDHQRLISEYQGILESLWTMEPKSHQVFLRCHIYENRTDSLTHIWTSWH